MYSRQIKIGYSEDGIPVADGLMRIGARAPLERLKTAMEDWFRKKSYLDKKQRLVVEETG